MKKIFYVVICLLFTISSCSTNYLKSKAPPSKQEQAEQLMEAKNYDAAVTLLEEIIADDPVNYNAKSLLAAAYAAKAGVILFDMIFKMTQSQSESTSGSGDSAGFSLFADALPDYDEDKENLLKSSVDQMTGIPTENKTEGMKTQEGLFQSALGFLVMKKFTSSVSAATFDPQKLSEMTPEQAITILNSLDGASASFGNEGLGNAVEKVNAAIADSEGSTREEKLKNYMAKKSQPAASLESSDDLVKYSATIQPN